MATFLKGVQDQVQGIRPPDPQLQFDAQLLATRQSKYDQSHNQQSKMYGTLLNAGLTRDDNIMAREEFFKLIESDLHKIAGMDLSKESNQTKAKGVFSQIYSNNHLVKDMVWTKAYQGEMQRAEGFKNCTDHEKCGGQYWDDGIKFMQYKREEFKTASRDESLNIGNTRYIPYNNMMDKALKDLKEMGGFEMITPSFSSDGKYRITTKNGEQAVKPMTAMFAKLYANNPEFHDMYKVMAYNGRKDWIYNSVASGKYGSVEEATVGYIEARRDDLEKQFDQMHKDNTHEYEKLKELSEAYTEDYNNGLIHENSPEYGEMTEIEELYQSAEGLKSYNDMVATAQKNMHRQQTVNTISDYLDNVESQLTLGREIEEVARLAAFKDYSVEMKADEYAVMKEKHKYNVALENLRFGHNKELELIKANDKKSEWRAQAFVAGGKYEMLKNDVAAFNPYAEAILALQKDYSQEKSFYVDPNIDADGVDALIKTGKIPSAYAVHVGPAVKDAQRKLKNMKINLNSLALTGADYYLRGGGGDDLNYTIDPTAMNAQQANMIMEMADGYSNNKQMAEWATIVLADPYASGLLGAFDEGATETSTNNVVADIGAVFNPKGVSNMMTNITELFTGQTTTVTADDYLLQKNQ